VSLWNLKENKIEKRLDITPPLRPNDLCFYPPHSILFFFDNEIKIYELYSLKKVKAFPLSVLSVFTISQNKLIYVNEAKDDNVNSAECQIFDLNQEKIITQWKVKFFYADRLLPLSNENLIALLSRSQIEIWNIQNHKRKCHLKMKPYHYVQMDTVLELSPDLLFFVSLYLYDHRMEIWDINKKQCIFKQECTSFYNAQKITSEYFIAQAFTLQIFEITNCKLIKTLNFQKRIRCIANAMHMNHLVIGFSDGTIEFWGGS